MILPLLTVAGFALAALPAALTLANLRLFRPAPQAGARAGATRPRVSVLVPARNEATAIEGCAVAVLASRDIEL